MQSTMMKTPLSLNTLLDRAGKLFPQSQIVSRLPDKSLRRHNFAQFHERARQLASALLGLGLKKGDRVATLGWNHHAHLECYFGIPAAGGVMHTLNLRLSPDEIGFIAAHAEDRFLIVDDVLLPLYRQFADRHRFERVIVYSFSGAATEPAFTDYEQLLAAAPPFAGYAPHDENDPVAMCYTSGTTGQPKGVVYSHRSTVLHSIGSSMPDFWSLSGRDTVLTVTPMFHANCWGMPYAAVMLGTKLVFPGPHLHPDDLLDLMQLEPPSFALGVPTIWLSVIQAFEANPGRWKLPHGLRSLVGGAAVPESLIRVYAKHGVTVVQGWGMTETSPLCTVSYLKPELQDISDDERVARTATAGVPSPMIELRIVADSGDGAEAPWDGKSVGEIQVRGPYITGSYYGIGADPVKFSADGWLRTGDVATVDSHGYVRITDRTKDLIKSGGEWISSVDLENSIMAHPAVAEAAVIAVPHDKWGERPLACVVFKPGQSATPDELNATLARHFARWQWPDAYEVMEAIPKTATGKFWKVKLRERFAARAA